MTPRLLPGSRLPLALFVVALGGVLPGVGAFVVAAGCVGLSLLAWWDARRARTLTPDVERQLPHRLTIAEQNTVHYVLREMHGATVSLTLRDDAPGAFEISPEALRTTLAPHQRQTLSLNVTPPARGAYTFGHLYARIEGPLGLGAADVRIEGQTDVQVLPDFSGQSRFDLALSRGDLRHFGFRRVRRAGGGGEFEQLREYVSGDSYRDVDWKSTAKRSRPVTKVHSQERSQNVLLVVDVGRWMAPLAGTRTRLDIAIEAALLLAHVALRQGDRVGLIVLGSDVRAFVPPSRGRGQYRRILDALYARQAEETVVDFAKLAEFLRLRASRRALVVLFSELFDETHGMNLVDAMPVLKRRHVPLCVSLDDAFVRERAHAASADADDFFERAAASDLLLERDGVRVRLRAQGVPLVESSASDLTLSVVNRYLEIRARGLV